MKRLCLAVFLLMCPVFAFAASLPALFAPDTLGSQIAWLKKQAGPEWRINGAIHYFKANGCVLEASVSKGVVVALSMDVSAACNPEITRFVASGPKVMAYPMTFGEVQGTGHYMSDCLSECGNAFDPSVYLFVSGYHANDFVDVTFAASTADSTVSEASSVWEGVMTKAKGEEYVVNAKFNCDTTFDAAAARALKGVRIGRVTVGHDTSADLCKGGVHY
jgi:hypothetical protein